MSKLAAHSRSGFAKSAATSGSPNAHGGKLKASGKPVVITMMAFAIMNFMTVVSLRGLPAQAEYGLVSIFYYVFAAVVFLIPTALVAAELASTFPKQGGVFRWVGEAFGPRWGFAAVYWQWQAWVLWLPAVLVFGAAALAFVWWPQSFDAALATNKYYAMAVLLVGFWAVTVLQQLASFGFNVAVVVAAAAASAGAAVVRAAATTDVVRDMLLRASLLLLEDTACCCMLVAVVAAIVV